MPGVMLTRKKIGINISNKVVSNTKLALVGDSIALAAMKKQRRNYTK